MCVSILPFRIVYFLVSRGLLLDVPGASLCWPGSSLGSFYCAIILGVPIAAFSSIGDIWFPFACVLVCLMWTDSERSCPVVTIALLGALYVRFSFCVSGLLWVFPVGMDCLPSSLLGLASSGKFAGVVYLPLAGRFVFLSAVLCSVLFTIL